MSEAEQTLITLLHEIAKEQKLSKYDMNVKEISTGGANYTSKLFTATLTEDKNEIHMFAKVACIGEKFREQIPLVFQTERFVYTSLANTFERLQDEHQVPEEHRVRFPKLYGCNPTMFQETIVLENLVAAGYNEFDRFKAIDWPYASSAMKELAKLHALAFAFAKYQPEEFEEVEKRFSYQLNFDGPENKMYLETMVSGALPKVKLEHRGKMRAFFDNLTTEDILSFYKATKRSVLTHGDFRPSNLMHKYRDDGTVEIKIVDLQTMQGGSPLIDLLYFIILGSDEAFRKAYFHKLLDCYYEELSEAMERFHLIPEEIYSREDFDHELKVKLPFGLFMAVFVLPIVTVETANAPSPSEDLDLDSFNMHSSSELYAERLNGIVNDYIKWGVLKSTVKSLRYKFENA